MHLDQILQALKEASERGYIGEPVSQLEHALQAAYFAKQDSPHNSSLIAAALLHDIGHLLVSAKTQYMEDLGVLNHEAIGAQLLKEAGFKEEVCELVRLHVDAKRYLVSKYDHYRKQLSEASQKTLAFQGGWMTDLEMKIFEEGPLFKEAIKIRHYDDAAKKKDFVVPDLDSYKAILYDACGN